MEVLHLAGALMEHLLEGSASLSSFGLMYQCLNGEIPSLSNVPLRHLLLKAKPPFMS